MLVIGTLDKQAVEQELTKAEAKRWAAIQQPMSLADGLSKLTKDELVTVRHSLGLAKQSSLKKQDLVDMTVEQLPQALAEAVTHMDEALLNVVRQLIGAAGLIPADTVADDVISGLNEVCLAFSGTADGSKVLVMTAEVLQALKHLVGAQAAAGAEAKAEAGANVEAEAKVDAEAKVEAETSVEAEAKVDAEAGVAAMGRLPEEWVTLTRGMLHYYGTVSKVKLHQLMEQYTKQTIPSADFYRMLADEAGRGLFQFDETNGVSDNGVKDPARIVKEHTVGSEVPFYPFSKQQLLEAGQPGYVNRHTAYKRFTSFLMENWSMSQVDADDIANANVQAIQERAGLHEIVQSLQEQLDIESTSILEGLVEHAVELMNHTPQWTLKGHTPSDLAARREAAVNVLAGGGVPKRTMPNVQVHVQQKVGRNEPCTCGSGKKYKKCCGAN